MLLKALEIQGFKTFPDKTKLTFDKGITSIVGPNGSGKSNISDAIRWVLGEQSAKAIRCSKMEDVVFNGTDNRKKLGFAEVTLTFENKDRALAFDGDEVAITRRYYRSGDSDYMINKAAVRLKDIHELFMDTGLGRDGYSMIGQGKIDSIVASKSEDRREIFEEAAGISRYRYRKLEAERKLKGTEENLVRLRDILTELDDRIGPLETQAKKAEAFLEYSNEKKELEIALWLNTIKQSATVLREQEEKLEIARSQHLQVEQTLDEIQKESEELFLKNNSYLAMIDEIRREISSYSQQIAEKKSSISVAENNIVHNNENIKRVEAEINSLESSAKDTEKEIKEKEKEINNHKNQIEILQKSYRECENNLNEINISVSKNSDMLQEISVNLAKLSARAADIKVSAMTSMASVSESKERITTLSQSKAYKQSQLQQIEQQCTDYEAMLSDINENSEKLSNTLSAFRLKLANKQKKREQLKEQSDKLNLDYQERVRRVRILEDLERNMEGFYNSVKIVIKEAQRGTLQGIHGPVSRVINVPSEYTVAIETALGNSMQHIVTEDENSAKSAINYLKQRDGGRATFLPLTTVKGSPLNEKGLDTCQGFIGTASQLCSCQSQYIGILNSLLGRIVIADNLNNAVSIAKKYGYKFRIVTLDGQVVNAGGSLTGGSQGKKSGLLSRAGEIQKNKDIALQLKEKSEESVAQYKLAQQEYSAIEAEIIGASAELTKANEEKIKIEAVLRSSKTEKNNIHTALTDIENEITLLTAKINKQSEIHSSSQKELDQLNMEISKAEKQSNSITGGRDELSAKREKLAEQLQNIRLDIVTAEKDIENIKAEISLARTNEATREQRVLQLNNEINEYNSKNNAVNTQLELLNQFVSDLQQKSNTAQGKIDNLNKERTETESKTTQLRQAERDKLNERELVGRELSKLEERKLNLQKQYDDIISKLWEEYELTPREAEEKAKPVENITTAKKRLNELKGKIKALGNVNVSAIEEFKEVSERHSFMTKQVGDVEKSKNEIIHLIGDLTKQMKELFVERFNQINGHFSKTFVELFGGGKAHLELTDPEDVLNSGIEIIVHPPGKIVVHLEALSGGEKALVAIALYFAIMKVSPAPFCVMDEIEAALDDVNVDRFAQYLRIMNDNTQFILITHRRGTMEEADVLYGVTMQDKGISKLLSLRASEVAEKLNMN
ncbi:MAG: chromosome segregation protein SMC [Acutalibacteraceae bacterium]|nr:chromosome segregation protein SMC [Acutalibacteraceae bacterium]